MTQSIMTFRDYSNEMTTTTVTSVPLSAANIVGQDAAFADFIAATQDLVLGELAQTSMNRKTVVSGDLPASPFAQREMKWLISYHANTTNKKFQIEIGTSNLGDDLILPGSDQADFSNALWIAWIAEAQAFMKSPDDPNEAITIDSAYFVGRKT